MLNAHPEIAYRFEPFHRAKPHSAFKALVDQLKTPDNTDKQQLVPDLYQHLLTADAAWEKPPFFEKTTIPNRGRRLLWPAARRLAAVNHLFRKRYTPPPGTPVVFKEVTQSAALRELAKTTVPLVFLVRSPFGTVDSLLRGQGTGKMPTGRFTVLDDLLKKHDPALHERWAAQLPDMSNARKNALLWRIDVESALRALDHADRGEVVTFEELCDDTHSTMTRICRAFQLDYTPEMRRFVDQLHRIGEAGTHDHWARDRYFSVFRNPRTQRDRWTATLPGAPYDEIMEVVDDSPVFRRLAEQGNWLDAKPLSQQPAS